MSYAQLNKDQTRYLRDLVKGKVVADLGCGGGMLTKTMARWGASMVHGVDKEHLRDPNSKKVYWHRSYLAYWKMPEDVEVAVVSWPQNSPLQGLQELLQAVPHVVYIGKNTNGTSCGNPALMRYLSGRAAIHHITQIANVLIHYGPGPRPLPEMYHEEYAATHQDQGVILYDARNDQYTENEWETKVHRS
mgnify:CR=1 FL=1